MGFLLYLLATIINIIMIVVGHVYGFFRCFWDTHIGDAFKKSDDKFRKMAIGLDIFGNVYAEEFFNDLLITKDAPYKFGNFGRTISAVLGYNILSKTLKGPGKLLVKILGERHCLSAIEE